MYNMDNIRGQELFNIISGSSLKLMILARNWSFLPSDYNDEWVRDRYAQQDWTPSDR